MCGADYSYCARQGYRTATRRDGQDPFSPVYAVCLDRAGQGLGTVALLSTLVERVSQTALPPKTLSEQTLPSDLPEGGGLPTSFDWRNHDGYSWLTPVKNQSSCGSCWAFAAVGVVEAHHNIRASDPDLDLDLAEQELVSCSSAGDCGGGSSNSALWYIHDAGIVDENCMPYQAANSSCNRCSNWRDRLTHIDYVDAFVPDRQSLQMSVVNYGPTFVYMGISSDYGGYFDGNGIYRCSDDSGINHAVVVVGYSDSGGYWIVRNSWGASWNGDGYFKVGYGECAIDSTWAGYAYDIPPTGQIIAPTHGEVLNSCPVTLQADASDVGSGVARVEFYAHYEGAWHHLGDDTTAPYSLEWDCSGVNSRYVWFTIHVVDNMGNEAVDPSGYIYVTLGATIPDNPVAFVSNRDGHPQIYLMSEDGTMQNRLTRSTDHAWHPALSPDGSKLAFISSPPYAFNEAELYVMDLSDFSVRRLTYNSVWDERPRWSPDGRHIAFNSELNSNWDIYVIDADGSNLTRLTTDAADDKYPTWSPDGTRIAFTSWRDGYSQIYVMNANGSNHVNLSNSAYFDIDPQWSPDGSRIVYYSYRNDSWEIMVMNADGSGQTRLTYNDDYDATPTWSSDGAEILFGSDRDGNLEIYRMKADGSEVTNLSANSSSDTEPSCPSRGQYAVYLPLVLRSR